MEELHGEEGQQESQEQLELPEKHKNRIQPYFKLGLTGAADVRSQFKPVTYLLSELKEEGPSLSRRCSSGPCCVSRCGSEERGGCG